MVFAINHILALRAFALHSPDGPVEKTIHTYAFRPQQQFPHTSGKNAADSALIIDAMDPLHSRTIGRFCIVSTDIDFTRLAIRVREEGFFIMGIGKPETPEIPFPNAGARG